MKRSIFTKLSLVLAVLTVFALASCNLWGNVEDTTTTTSTTNTATTDGTGDANELTGLWADALYTEDTELGEGAKTVQVEVKAEERSITFTVHTDAETLGEALLALGLVEGESSQYGLYVKKVNGMLADYDVDGSWWGFYSNGEYMMTGVDGTAIEGGEHFELVREK